MPDALHAPESQPVESAPFTGPLVLVVNTVSGDHADNEATCDSLRRALQDGGREHHLMRVDRPEQLAGTAQRAVRLAGEIGGAVVAVGGDGTLRTVAQAVLPHEYPFGVVPHGTFNMFGRCHGLPLEPGAAVRALLEARPEPVQVGLVNDRVFLVNASLGLYPQLLEDREAWKQRFGRRRAVALCAALVTLLREHRQLALRIEDDAGTARGLRAWTVVVGNNALQLGRIGIDEAPVAGNGKLVGILVKPVGRVATFGMLLRGALGQLGDAGNISTFAFERLAVTAGLPYGRRQLRIAVDGEIVRLTAPLAFRVSPVPLRLLKPPQATADAGS